MKNLKPLENVLVTYRLVPEPHHVAGERGGVSCVDGDGGVVSAEEGRQQRGVHGGGGRRLGGGGRRLDAGREASRGAHCGRRRRTGG